jgi:putative transposase
MNLGHKYRIYPTADQQEKLARVFGTCRFIYNWGLAMQNEAYRNGKKLGYTALCREYTQLRKSPEFPWLAEIQYDVADRPLRNLNAAFSGFFSKKRKYPKFKKKNGTQSVCYRSNYFKIRNNRLIVSRIGDVNIVWTRELPSKPGSLTISKTSSGMYYVSFRIEKQAQELPRTNETVGVDVGVTTFAALSTGEKIDRFTHGLDAKLKRAQRRLARKQKGSNRRSKQRVKVARIYEKIANKREDFQHKASISLIRRFDVIFLEDLNASGMVKNHNLARSIQAAAFRSFRSKLEYKAQLYGRKVVAINRFFPSSKLCSECGVKVESLPLDVREWDCSCGAHHDRDINAAINIKAAGTAVLARGEDVRPASGAVLDEA